MYGQAGIILGGKGAAPASAIISPGCSPGSSHSASGWCRTPRAWPGSSATGRIDVERFKGRLKLCCGQMAAVMASRLDPETTLVLKGNKPHGLRIHRRHRGCPLCLRSGVSGRGPGRRTGLARAARPRHEPDGVPAPGSDGIARWSRSSSLRRRGDGRSLPRWRLSMTGRARSTRPGEPPKENTLELPTLFVHGTLKSGYWNRDPFCGGALEIREARIRGRLYEGPGFPGPRRSRTRMSSPRGSSTRWPTSPHRPSWRADRRAGPVGSHSRPVPKAPQRAPGAPCTGSCLPSTILTTRIAHHRPPFCPGGSNLYQRVLLHATVKGARELAWVYTAEATGIKRHRIVSGSNRHPPPSPQSAPLLVRVIPITAEF